VNRLAAAGAAVLAVLAASGCGVVPDASVAATVGDDDISVDEVESLMRDVTSLEGSGIALDPATGTVDGGFARQVLSLMVTSSATNEFLAAHGEAITDADRQPILDTIAEDDPSRQFPAVLDLLVDFDARETAVARVDSAVPEDLQARYEASPSELGVLCVRHILLDTEADAQAVLDELAAGAGFEELAVERSTDQSAAQNQGAIEITPGQACATIGAAREAGLDATFVAAAEGAVPGEPIGPVQTDFGWHVILARPYAEVADSLVAVSGQLAFAEYLDDLPITVDARYGRWDAATGAVVALQP
jgi:peptidyl-prolyl cis-trans isomerase C